MVKMDYDGHDQPTAYLDIANIGSVYRFTSRFTNTPVSAASNVFPTCMNFSSLTIMIFRVGFPDIQYSSFPLPALLYSPTYMILEYSYDHRRLLNYFGPNCLSANTSSSRFLVNLNRMGQVRPLPKHFPPYFIQPALFPHSPFSPSPFSLHPSSSLQPLSSFQIPPSLGYLNLRCVLQLVSSN